MEIRAGPAACSAPADEPSPAESAAALRSPEELISCAPTPSSLPDNRFSVSPDPTASMVNEGLSGVARSRDYAAFGVGAGIRLKPLENEGVRRNHGGAEIECGGGGAGPFGAGGADKSAIQF